MQNVDLTSIIVKSTIEQSISGIETDPERTIRRFVEYGCYYTKGRFQSSLFNAAHNMLKHDDSAYYEYAKRIVRDVNHDSLRTFGFNIGYNGCTYGANLIRANEAKFSFNIPWTVVFHVDAVTPSGIELLKRIVNQGIECGVYTYFVYCKGESLLEVLFAIECYKNCAFIVIADPEAIGDAEFLKLKELHHVLISFDTSSHAYLTVAQRAHHEKILFAAHLYYNESNADFILSNDWLNSVLPSSCMCGLLIADSACSYDTRNTVSEYTINMRENQKYPLLLTDVITDIKLIDRIISDESCSIIINLDGHVVVNSKEVTTLSVNDINLCEILERFAPKHK